MKTKPSLCPLSPSCYCENRKQGFVFTPGLPCAPAEPDPLPTTTPPNAALPPSAGLSAPLPSCPPGLMVPQMRPQAWQALPCSWRSEFTLPRVFSLPSTQGFNSSVADGRLLSVLSLCQSGKPDRFSRGFNFNFLCKGFCDLEDVWHMYQYLYRHTFLKNAFSVWVYGPKDDRTCGNNYQKLNELIKDVCSC